MRALTVYFTYEVSEELDVYACRPTGVLFFTLITFIYSIYIPSIVIHESFFTEISSYDKREERERLLLVGELIPAKLKA